MNKVVLYGFMVRTPELRYSSNNMAIGTFSLAVTRDYQDKDGINVDFINIVTFNKTAENVCKYCDKGSAVIVEGEIRTTKYQKEDKTSYNTQIVANKVRFVDRKGNSTLNQENSVKVPKNGLKDNGLKDKVFEEFGSQIELAESELGF